MPERYRVEYTAAAQRDFARIYGCIADDSPETARRFLLELERQIDSLERLPRRCRVLPEKSPSGYEYRHLIYGNYRTIFRFAERTVWIVRIVHGAQLIDPLDWEPFP